MNIAALNDVNMKNPESVRVFLDLHAIDHETIFTTLMSDRQITIDHYPMWSEQGISKDWLWVHDREHRAISDATGLYLPVDLNALDVNNDAQVSDWLTNHQLAHSAIVELLGL